MRLICSLFIDSQDILAPTVTDSQVVELIVLLSQREIEFRYVNIVGVRYLMRNYTAIKARRKGLEARLKRNILLVKTLKPGNRLGKMIARSVIGLFILAKYGLRAPVFIHARGHAAVALALPLKKVFKKMAILFDIRGDLSSELHFNMEAHPEMYADRDLPRMVSRQAREEKLALTYSDEVACVSNRLLETLLRRHGIVRTPHFHVFPSAANGDSIFIDENVRIGVRDRLGIQNKKVMLYSGGVGMWHETSRLLDAFAVLSSRISESYVLFLTPYTQQAQHEIDSRVNSIKNYLVKSVPHDEINDYLNAADFGILLRRPDPLNAAACPTKFSEYMLAGLPVLISDGIGDCSGFVRAHSAGIVLRDLQSDEELRKSIDSLLKSDFDRPKIRSEAMKVFSKQSYLDEYERMLKAYIS